MDFLTGKHISRRTMLKGMGVEGKALFVFGQSLQRGLFGQRRPSPGELHLDTAGSTFHPQRIPDAQRNENRLRAVDR